MLVEEVTKKNIRKAKNKDLYSLRLRALQVWDKNFIRKKEDSSIPRKEFLEKYSTLVDEMKSREIYKNTYAVDQVLFFQKMHGVDVPSLETLPVIENFVLLCSDMKKGGIAKGENCKVVVQSLDYDKVREAIKKHLDKYFDGDVTLSDSIDENMTKAVPMFDMVLVPKKKTEISDINKAKTEDDIEKSESKKVPIIKVDTKKQIVAAVVYSPGEVDSQGDTTTAEEIEEACHKFNLGHPRFRINHGNKDIDVDLLESYTLPLTGKIGTEEIVKGSWIILAKIKDKDAWAKIDKGDLTGISMRGFANKEEVEVDS